MKTAISKLKGGDSGENQSNEAKKIFFLGNMMLDIWKLNFFKPIYDHNSKTVWAKKLIFVLNSRV